MKNNTVVLFAAVVAVIGVGLFLARSMMQSPADQVQGNQNNGRPTVQQPQTEGETIVDIAASDSNFSILVEAVTKAGLAETLSGEGPFTVFAPTNEAFAKLPEATLQSVLNDKEALIKILTYHVVSGKVMSDDVVKLSSATTVQGQDVLIKTENGKVMINQSEVVQADIEASNGVIHVIDTVLLPR